MGGRGTRRVRTGRTAEAWRRCRSWVGARPFAVRRVTLSVSPRQARRQVKVAHSKPPSLRPKYSPVQEGLVGGPPSVPMNWRSTGCMIKVRGVQ